MLRCRCEVTGSIGTFFLRVKNGDRVAGLERCTGNRQLAVCSFQTWGSYIIGSPGGPGC
jgi:hypothetical protein